jgi:hypothetical protein
MPNRRVMRWPLASLVVGVVLLTGCSSPGGTGTVTGIFETSGGPGGYQPHRLPGSVVFTNSEGERVAVRVGTSGALVVKLPGGTYSAVGHSPMVHSGSGEMTCHALKPVKVTVGHTQKVTVACQLM